MGFFNLHFVFAALTFPSDTLSSRGETSSPAPSETNKRNELCGVGRDLLGLVSVIQRPQHTLAQAKWMFISLSLRSLEVGGE